MSDYVKFFIHWQWISFIVHFCIFFTVCQCALYVKIFRKAVNAS